jgi:energy-converting hydrogenase Eha subunit A
MGIYVTHVIALAATRIILSKLGVHALPVHLILGVSAGVLGPYLFYVLAERFRLLRPLGLGRDRRKVTEHAAST